jgi:hypothetical protein
MDPHTPQLLYPCFGGHGRSQDGLGEQRGAAAATASRRRPQEGVWATTGCVLPQGNVGDSGES